MDRRRFYGAFTALITPFTSNGIDEAAYKKLIDWQIRRAFMVLSLAGQQVNRRPFLRKSMSGSLSFACKLLPKGCLLLQGPVLILLLRLCI